jgi:hypothetical protein
MARKIGISGIECFKGPCDPWVLTKNCHNCPIRPMKVYQGNNTGEKSVKVCQQQGIGILLCAGYRNPDRFAYYAVDNGAFSSWINNRPWDPVKFLKLLDKLETVSRAPDFVIVPDKVAAGNESLDFSLAWRDKLPNIGTRYYLAVQDGMSSERVDDVLDSFGGLFVGGTMDWKLQTAEEWVELAHVHRKPCHIGRIGTWGRIVWAAQIDADSIDSTSWGHNDSWHHIEYAQRQEVLTDWRR